MGANGGWMEKVMEEVFCRCLDISFSWRQNYSSQFSFKTHFQLTFDFGLNRIKHINNSFNYLSITIHLIEKLPNSLCEIIIKSYTLMQCKLEMILSLDSGRWISNQSEITSSLIYNFEGHPLFRLYRWIVPCNCLFPPIYIIVSVQLQCPWPSNSKNWATENFRKVPIKCKIKKRAYLCISQ